MTTMRSIAVAVARRHGLSVDSMLSERRFKWLVHARQEAMYLMVEEHSWSLPRIGMFFDRDHTTVIHGHRAHKKRLVEAASRAWPENPKTSLTACSPCPGEAAA